MYYDRNGVIYKKYWPLFYPLRSFPEKLKKLEGKAFAYFNKEIHSRIYLSLVWSELLLRDGDRPYAN